MRNLQNIFVFYFAKKFH